MSISQGLNNFSGSLQGIADDLYRKDRIAADRSERALMEKLFTEYSSSLVDERNKILMDKTLAPDQYYQQFEEKATAVRQKMISGLTPEQQQDFDTAHGKALLHAKDSFSNIQLARFEHSQATLEASTREKAVIEYSTNLKLATANIINDPDIDDEKKYSEINRIADVFKDDLKNDMVRQMNTLLNHSTQRPRQPRRMYGGNI